jgi:hypothetical protein
MVGKSHESNEHILVWGGGEVMEGLPKKVAPGTRKALGGPDPNVIPETLMLYVNNEFECFIRGSKHEKTV